MITDLPLVSPRSANLPDPVLGRDSDEKYPVPSQSNHLNSLAESSSIDNNNKPDSLRCVQYYNDSYVHTKNIIFDNHDRVRQWIDLTNAGMIPLQANVENVFDTSIAISFTCNLDNYFRLASNGRVGLRILCDDTPENGMNARIVTDHSENIRNAETYINNLRKNKSLLEFAHNIKLLDDNHLVDRDVRKNFRQLFYSLVNERIEVNELSYSQIIKHFSKKAVKYNKNPGSALDPVEIKQSARELHKAIYGKPMNMIVKACIYGIIGAMIGAFVSLLVGVILTGWSGGIGGLPAAIIGAAKGYSVASSIAINATASSTFVAGFFVGLFSASKNTKQHIKDGVIEKNKMNTAVSDVVSDLHREPRWVSPSYGLSHSNDIYSLSG